LSLDGQFLYSGSGNGIIREWKIDDSKLQREFDAHQSSVNAIVMSSDGKLLYSVSEDSTIEKWDVQK
jgi:WD40 repeat protein